jgi:hypothetical protein
MRLNQLQQGFLEALLTATSPAKAAAAGHALGIRGGEFAAAERLSIYRNNLRENFLQLLQREYPAIQALAGVDYFRQTALQYLAAYPSRSGDLLHAGAAFPEFLRGLLGSSEYAYFADVAALEWALQQAMIAADDARSFDAAALADLSLEQTASVRLELHPAVRLVCSEFPIVSIWQAHQPGAPADLTIDLSRGGENALLYRPERRTAVASIDHARANFVAQIVQSAPFGVAADAALAADPDCDLGAILRQLIAQRVLVAWHLA